MKKKHVLLLSSMLLLSACGAANAQETGNQMAEIELTTESAVEKVTSTAIENNTNTTEQVEATNQDESTAEIQTSSDSELFSARDLDATYEAVTAKISLNGATAQVDGSGASFENQILTITTEGVYELSGSSDGIQIVVAADENAKVQLVFNGVTMINEESPILIESADKVFLTMADNSQNSLQDGSTRQDESIDAVIFSRSDLTINGTGQLDIVGNYYNGIDSKDDLKIVNAAVTIQAVNHGLNTNDALNVQAATIDIKAGKDGLHAENSDDATLGNIYLNPNTLTIQATEDGVDEGNELVIAGGNVDVQQSTEGLEAKTITVQGGTISVVSSDDGLNASAGSDGSEEGQGFGGQGGPGFGMMAADSDLQIIINDGTLIVNAEGDGLDSNGALTINGGEVYVEGSQMGGNGAIDSNGTATINSGTVIAIGTADMAQGLTAGAEQGSVSANVSGEIGSLIEISDEQGNVLASYTAKKPFQSVVASVEGMAIANNYLITVDGNETVVEATSAASQNQMGGGPRNMMPPTGGDQAGSVDAASSASLNMTPSDSGI